MRDAAEGKLMSAVDGRWHMAKDSQPDNKRARKEKAKGQTPLTRENQNQNRNAKKQSIGHNDV